MATTTSRVSSRALTELRAMSKRRAPDPELVTDYLRSSGAKATTAAARADVATAVAQVFDGRIPTWLRSTMDEFLSGRLEPSASKLARQERAALDKLVAGDRVDAPSVTAIEQRLQQASARRMPYDERSKLVTEILAGYGGFAPAWIRHRLERFLAEG